MARFVWLKVYIVLSNVRTSVFALRFGSLFNKQRLLLYDGHVRVLQHRNINLIYYCCGYYYLVVMAQQLEPWYAASKVDDTAYCRHEITRD